MKVCSRLQVIALCGWTEVLQLVAAKVETPILLAVIRWLFTLMTVKGPAVREGGLLQHDDVFLSVVISVNEVRPM